MASNIELYLSRMLGEDVETPSPFSRIELQLARLLGEDVECPAPQSRVEALLEKLNENGLSGGGSNVKGIAEWTKIEGLTNVISVDYGNGLWVAACGVNGIYYSEDGINWSKAQIYGSALGEGFDYNCVNSVKYNGSAWVAGGYQDSSVDTDGDGYSDYCERYPCVFTTKDGKKWYAYMFDMDVSGLAAVDGLYYNNGVWHATLYIAVSGSYVAYYSESVDGTGGWGSCTGASFYDGHGRIQYINGVWYLTTDSAFHKSTDGKSWTKVYNHDSYNGLDCIFGSDIWVVVDYCNGTVVWSKDLSTWTPVSGLSFTSNLWIHYVDGVWLANESYTGMRYSVNGKDWYVALSSEYETSLVYTDGLFYARKEYEGGTLPEYYTSKVGLVWEESSITNLPTKMFKIKNRYVCTISGGLFYSDDGYTWTETNITSGANTGSIITNGSVAIFYNRNYNYILVSKLS